MSDSPERRDHERHPLVLRIVLDVELHGFADDDERFRAVGETINLSRGGMLAVVDRELDEGQRCVAHFPNAHGAIGRTMIYGIVRRAVSADDRHEVAMIFDTPLQAVEMPTAD